MNTLRTLAVLGLGLAGLVLVYMLTAYGPWAVLMALALLVVFHCLDGMRSWRL